MLVVYSLARMGALPTFSLSFPGGYSHASMFLMQKLAGIDFDSQGHCCMQWLAESSKSIHQSWHFPLEIKSVTTAAHQQLPEKHPSQPCLAALPALLHTAAIHPLPLKNLLLRTRKNMSLNNGQVTHKNPFGQQHGQLCLSAPGCFPPQRPRVLSQDGVSLPHAASRLPLIPELCLFSYQVWSGGLSEQDKGFALCHGSV